MLYRPQDEFLIHIQQACWRHQTPVYVRRAVILSTSRVEFLAPFVDNLDSMCSTPTFPMKKDALRTRLTYMYEVLFLDGIGKNCYHQSIWLRNPETRRKSSCAISLLHWWTALLFWKVCRKHWRPSYLLCCKNPVIVCRFRFLVV